MESAEPEMEEEDVEDTLDETAGPVGEIHQVEIMDDQIHPKET